MTTISLSTDWVDDSAWKYYAEKYNFMRKTGSNSEPRENWSNASSDTISSSTWKVEKDRERSQSNPHCMRNDLVWCYRKDQKGPTSGQSKGLFG
jgi:hypothetical protein